VADPIASVVLAPPSKTRRVTELDFLSPTDLFPGAPYHYLAVARPGSTIFTAGACPIDANGVVTDVGNPQRQAAVAVENLLIALAAAGAGPEHLARTTIYVVGDRTTLVRVWDVIASRLAPHRPPSTLLGVSVLGYADQLVEIDGIAVLPSEGRSGA
jgi:enamine deaminase RidA (YjgF/YER057c/UK114 family)